MLRTRVLTGLIALAAILALVILAPDWFFTLFVGAATSWGLYEVAQMYVPDQPLIMSAFMIAGGVPAVWLLYARIPDWWVPAVVIAAMTGLTIRIGFKGADGGAHTPGMALLGALYVGVLFPYFALLRNQPDGVRLIILSLLLVVAGDTGAYLVGRSWGRIKLAPRVSPGKTVEGAIASIAASLLTMVLLRGALADALSMAQALVFAFAINVMAQVGDLAESSLKRIAGVKDSGWLFPGHGGLLDRADSLVFAAVFTYYYLQ